MTRIKKVVITHKPAKYKKCKIKKDPNSKKSGTITLGTRSRSLLAYISHEKSNTTGPPSAKSFRIPYARNMNETIT